MKSLNYERNRHDGGVKKRKNLIINGWAIYGMNIDAKRKAKYYLLCIKYGCFSLEEARSWSESIIENENIPEYQLIEILTSKNKAPAELIKYFDELSVDVEDGTVIYEVIMTLIDYFASKHDFNEFNKKLYPLVHNDVLSDEIKSLIYQIDHYIGDGCLQNGYVSSTEVINKIETLRNKTKDMINAQQKASAPGR